ncbi:MAG: chemotaxis protein [Desulfobacca sp.]|nr:chemotaxis protein [Desulfobacca sp.]
MKHQQIIIKKVKGKGHGGGHHGGEWKVAYADFITAMMAFFLLMWLIAILSPDKKENMAAYFKQFSFMQMGGASFFDKTDGIIGGGGPIKASLTVAAPAGGPNQLSREELRDELKKEVETKLSDVKDQVLIDTFEGGVRIQLTDKEGNPMFLLGSPDLTANAKKILKTITSNIKDQTNDVAIEGHTDALNYVSSKYTNWELSTERASAARKVLEAEGFNSSRLIRVAGYASKELLIRDNPNDPRNRRISIILLYNNNSKKEIQIPLPGSGLPPELIGDYNKAKPLTLSKTSS